MNAVLEHEPAAATTRKDAIALARTGAPLNSKELMLILGIKPSWFYACSRAGKYDRLKVSAPIGSRMYSGTLIARWLDGEHLDPIVRRHF